MSSNNSRYNYPIYIRKVSTTSDNDHPDLTGRSISSSSASMMSTPSNNVRKVLVRNEQQKQQEGQLSRIDDYANGHRKIHEEGQDYSKSERDGLLVPRFDRRMKKPQLPKTSKMNVKSKLLNLLRSSKVVLKAEGNESVAAHINETLDSITFKKPESIQLSDISNFGIPIEGTRKPEQYEVAEDDGKKVKKSLHLGCKTIPVKESQKRAWESAQKISSHLIFDDSSDSSDDESNSLVLKSIIKSIPGYTNIELEFLKSRDEESKPRGGKGANYYQETNKEEQQLVGELRQRRQVAQERVFAQHLAPSDKRKIQIAQKKEVLERIFGISNNLNQNFITNNNAAFTVADSQLMFQDDKEEISQLIEENEAYKNSITEMGMMIQQQKNPSFPVHIRKKGTIFDGLIEGGEIDSGKFQIIVRATLDKSYLDAVARLAELKDEDYFKEEKSKQREEGKELQSTGFAFLRNRIKRDEME